MQHGTFSLFLSSLSYSQPFMLTCLSSILINIYQEGRIDKYLSTAEIHRHQNQEATGGRARRIEVPVWGGKIDELSFILWLGRERRKALCLDRVSSLL